MSLRTRSKSSVVKPNSRPASCAAGTAGMHLSKASAGRIGVARLGAHGAYAIAGGRLQSHSLGNDLPQDARLGPDPALVLAGERVEPLAYRHARGHEAP